jgi:hypothetical protein
VPKKAIVKVVLSPEQVAYLQVACHMLGTSQSETLRLSFLDYVKELGIIQKPR